MHFDTEMSIVANAAQFIYQVCEVTSDFARFDDKEIMNKLELPAFHNDVLHTASETFEWNNLLIEMVLTYAYRYDAGWRGDLELFVDGEGVFLLDEMTTEECHVYLREMDKRRNPHKRKYESYSTDLSQVVQSVIERHIESVAELTA